MRLLVLKVITVALWLSSTALVFADEFRYIDEAGDEVTISARMIGEGRGYQALERTDGQIQLVSNGAIQDRKATEDPEPISYSEMETKLKELFGEELVRVSVNKPFLVALVLSSPIEKSVELKATAFIKKASVFMKNVNTVFLNYAKSMKFPLEEPHYPLVLLIFESDDDFNKYTAEATGAQGLSASVIAGFYSGLTNWLAVRMGVCDTFEVPLHEAIHQQMYNRVFKRLASIPKWFDEGIATGFESSGDRIDVNPAKINSRYARQYKAISQRPDWEKIVSDDSAFTADVLAGDAYTLAWCMHWMLATQHKEEYQAYVNELAKRPPLGLLEEQERLVQFEKTLGVTVSELQADFPRALEANLRRQKVDLNPPQARDGRAQQQQALGEYDIVAQINSAFGGQVRGGGSLKNISPLRMMTFYVTLETGSGFYADWLITDLKPGASRNLPPAVAAKLIPGATSGTPGTYQVWVRSAPSGSREAENWKNGNIPAPVTGQ